MRDWKMRQQNAAGVENAGPIKYGKPNNTRHVLTLNGCYIVIIIG